MEGWMQFYLNFIDIFRQFSFALGRLHEQSPTILVITLGHDRLRSVTDLKSVYLMCFDICYPRFD